MTYLRTIRNDEEEKKEETTSEEKRQLGRQREPSGSDHYGGTWQMLRYFQIPQMAEGAKE